MTAGVFFDTNILVYAAVGTGKDDPKRKRALSPPHTPWNGLSSGPHFLAGPSISLAAVRTQVKNPFV